MTYLKSSIVLASLSSFFTFVHCGGNTATQSDGGSDAASTDVTVDQANDVAVKDAVSDAPGEGGDASDGGLPVVPLVTGTYATGGVWGPSQGGAPPNYPGGLWGGQTCTFNTKGELLQISNASWSLSTTAPIAELGADGIVGWGRWATGTSTMGGSSTISHFHYIVGTQAPAATNIKASYTVFASTAPTAVGTSTVIGTANQITGTVTYNGSSVTYSLDNISVGGDTFSITGSAGLYATTGFLAGGTVTSTVCDGGCVGNITNAPMAQGWFIGSNGERAALNFGFTSPLGTVSGAVVLK